jgi:hypothetical protein
MKKLFDPRKLVVPPSPSRSKYRVVFVVGGMKQSLVRQLARQKNTVVFVIDVDEETGRIRMLMVAYGVQTFSLGTYESLATLCEHANPHIRAAARKVAAMLAREGCGASPMAGRLAGLKLVQTREFQHALDAVIDRAIKATSGRLPHFEVIVLGSYCGGVCAGTATVVAEAMMDKLATLPVTVKVVLDLVGATTVTGISPLAGQNAAATLPHLVHFAVTANKWKYRRMMVNVHLSELPPFGQDRESRDQLIGLDEQSIRSLELQEELNRMSPNQATTGRLGNVVARELEIFQVLHVDREILPTVAARFLSELSDAREQVMSDPSIVRGTRWNPQHRSLHRLSIAEIVDRAESFTFEEFCRAVFRPGDDLTYAWQLDLGPEGEFELAKVDEYFADPPATGAAAVKRLSLLATFVDVAQQDAAVRQDEIADLNAEIDGRMPRLRKLFLQVQHPAFWQNAPRLAGRLLTEAQQLRDTHDHKLDLEAQLTPINLGRAKVKVEGDFLDARLDEVQKMLEKFAPRGRDTFRGDLLVLPMLDAAFADLWRMTLQGESEQRAGLCRLASIVSLEGLAQIVRSPVAKVDDIAQQIVEGNPTVQCPPHGGLVRTDHILTAYVLPPMDGAFAELLRTKIRLLDPSPKSIVVFNDSTEAGITVGRYTFRDFKDVEQLMAGMLWHDLQRAEDSPTGTLRFPTSESQLDELRQLLQALADELATELPQAGDDEPDALWRPLVE